jgi:tetratricopeptide (TPR) repeat protein
MSDIRKTSEAAPPSAGEAAGRRLDSWKAIAAYVNRDVTTVRRWERQEGLPVHRHRHAALGSVYAFTGEIDRWQSNRDGRFAPEVAAPVPDAAPVLVGRSQELRRLRGQFDRALAGTRQTVFISGELGIGKTALTRAFVDGVRSEAWIAMGQCVEQYGRGEPYLPVVEALGRVVRESRDAEVRRIVETHAPSWLNRIGMSSRGRDRGHTAGREADPGRASGELVAAVEALAAVKPVVLVIEDLHWSDHSTVEFIARLGRRPDRARLLLIGTYRLADLFDAGSPLLRVSRELHAHFQADEIELSLLTQEAIAALISRDRRWRDAESAALRLRRWSGNPLFLVHLLEHLELAGRLHDRDGEWVLELEDERPSSVPRKLRTLIEDQVDRLGDEHQQLVDAAAVAGDTWSAALVSHAAQHDIVGVERAFEDLCRRSHLVMRRDAPVPPAASSSASYGFVHEFYRRVVLERIPSATLTLLHRRTGEYLEERNTSGRTEIASELASHFESGGDVPRAVRYYVDAADNALARNADGEAQLALSRAGELVVQLQPGETRESMDHALRTRLQAVLVRRSRALSLASAAPSREEPELLECLLGLSRVQVVAGDIQSARDVAAAAVAVARATRRGVLDASAQNAVAHYLAGHFTNSRSLASGALAAADADGIPESHPERTRCSLVMAWSAWCLGLYDESRQTLDRVLSGPQSMDPSLVAAWAAPLVEWFGDSGRSLELVDAVRPERKASSDTTAPWPIDAVHGWLRLRRGHVEAGVAALVESAADLRRAGLYGSLAHVSAWLVEGLARAGQFDGAVAAAKEGLDAVRSSGARCCDPELYRLRGEALAARSRVAGGQSNTAARDAAEASFWAAISVARQQEAKMLELRATVSLARLLLESGQRDEVVNALGPLCEVFVNVTSSPDIDAARQLVHAATR